MIVLDASAMVEVLLGTPAAKAVEGRLLGTGLRLQAPHLLDAEVAHVLRRLAAIGGITPQTGQEALADLADLHLRRHAHDWLLPRVWELRHNLTAYDAVYVALAEALDAPLVTRDKRLAATSGHQARVEVM
jgi:predicted nucleic acid-binding protein